MPTIAQLLSAELNQPLSYVENVIALLGEGNTVPFIARYRKELHGAMDDTTLRTLETRLAYLRGLQQRREDVLLRKLQVTVAALLFFAILSLLKKL